MQDEKRLNAGQKWKLPPNGQPICLFSGNPNQYKTVIRGDDDSKYLVLSFFFLMHCLSKLGLLQTYSNQW